MAKSLRSTPGQRQTYNLYDADDIYRAQKAINERITQIAETFGTDSQIYRDYIAPLQVGSLTPHVRVDSKGRTKFRTGKNDQNADVVYVLEKMLGKSTAGEILERTAEQMDMAINVQHSKATKRKVGKRTDVIKAAKSIHELEITVYGRLDELYELAEQKTGSREKAKEYINKVLGKRKFMKDIHDSHGKLSEEDIRYADKYLSGRTNRELLKLDQKKKPKQTKLQKSVKRAVKNVKKTAKNIKKTQRKVGKALRKVGL